MLENLKTRILQKIFYCQTKDILNTKPIHTVDCQLCIVSMLTDDYVQMYILSMKSFYRLIGKGKIIVIIDDKFTRESRDVLTHHFPGISFQMLADIDVGPCQHGGTWERLLYILDRSKTEYVIQLDADTLSIGPDLRDVIDCIENNKAFTLNGGEKEIVSVKEAAIRAASINHPYVGLAVEKMLPQYPGAEHLKYVRGSSGFAGFAKGGFDRAKIEEFHIIMERMMPARWTEWGTEQCASNFAVANSPNAAVLPFPKYANFEPDIDPGKSNFLHFIGSYRFDKGVFASAGRRVISGLNR